MDPRIAIPPLRGSPENYRPGAGQAAVIGGETMGTTWRVDLFVDDTGALTDIDFRCRLALEQIISEMSQWEADSDLSRFKRLPAGAWMALPRNFAQVMAEAIAIAKLTGGAFDPTIGAASELWGFGGRAYTRPPAAGEIESAGRSVGWKKLAFDPEMKRLRQPGGVSLDLSAIAKGHAVDRLAQELEAAGIRGFLVEIGGELRAHGVKPDGQPWWVGFAPETERVSEAPLRIALSGWAIATSSNAVRYREVDGHRLGHTLSPRSAAPELEPALSVTVLDQSAARADALATALMVMGENGPVFASDNSIAARITLPRTVGPTEILTPAFRAMV